MKEERIKNLIRAWRERSHNEGDQFASFVFVWFCFNAWLEYVSNGRTDRAMLEELKSKSPHMNTLLDAYDDAQSSDQFFQRSLRDLINKSNKEAIKDVRGNRQPISIKDETDWENIIEALYRIRCNLFHGGKDANDLRDQVLVQDAAMILRQWVGKLVASWDR